MQIVLPANILKDALNKIFSVVDRKSSRPILTNCLFHVQNNKLTISAMNSEISAQVHIGIQSEDEKKFCINAKNIFDIIREMPDRPIFLYFDNESQLLQIKCEKIQFSLNVSDAEEFPMLPFHNQNESFFVNSSDLLNILTAISHSISLDETRLYLNGIFVKKVNEKLRSVATDGHRLALLETSRLRGSNEFLDEGFIIPKKGVLELKKMADSYPDQDIECKLSESLLCVSANDEYFLATRLIAREYPKYEAVIPKQIMHTVKAKKNNLLMALKRIKLLAQEKSHGIKLNLSPGQLTISSNHQALGTATETIEVEYEGSNVELGFNANYLIESVSVLKDDSVEFGFNNELGPITIKSPENDGYLGIVMPLKL